MQSNGGQGLGLRMDGYQQDGAPGYQQDGSISPTCQSDGIGNVVVACQQDGTKSKGPLYQSEGGRSKSTGYLPDNSSKGHVYKRKAILHTRGGQFEKITIEKVIQQVEPVGF